MTLNGLLLLTRTTNKKMNRLITRITGLVLMLFVMLIPFAAMAQGDPGCDPLDPACPIDGGLGLLIAAGVGIAARKSYQQNKKK